MKTAKFLSVAAIAVLIFSACKKDSATSTSTLQKLQAKWNFQKDYYHEHYTGTPDYRDTTYGQAGDYVDFRTDGKVYSRISGGAYYDTSNYALLGDSKIVISYGGSSPGSDTAEIQVLTDTQLQLHSKVYDPAPDYYEDTQYFTK